MSKINFENLKESYEFTCAVCGYEQNANPSLMMKSFRENSGAGSCVECKEFLHLKITQDGERMESMKWDEYLQARNLVKENV